MSKLRILDEGCEIVNTSSCAGHTVRPNKLKCRSLEQRKVYCKAMQRDKVARALKSLQLPKGFWQSILFFLTSLLE